MTTKEELCPRCFIGVMRFSLEPYTLLWKGQVISVTDSPAYTCDICAYREYEDELVNWVHELIGASNAENEEPRPRKQPKSSHKT